MIDSTARALGLATLALLVASCAPFPQNADEYRAVMAAHRRGRIEHWSVSDRPADVVERLETAFTYCIDRREVSCSQGCTTEIHVHRREPSAGDRTTISVRVLINGRSPRRAPPEGMIEMMVDVDAAGRATDLTWYGGDHQLYAPYFDAIRRWSERIEHPVACPDTSQPRLRDLRRATPSSSASTDPASSTTPPSSSATPSTSTTPSSSTQSTDDGSTPPASTPAPRRNSSRRRGG